MCRGLAVLLDKSGKVLCSDVSSHSELAETADVEDSSLKYEIIVNDSKKQGYEVLIDHQYEAGGKDTTQAKDCLKVVKDWVAGNELAVLRGLLSCQSYAKRKKNTYNSSQETEGNTDNSSQETKGNTDNSSQETEGNTNNSSQVVGGEWYCGLVKLRKYPVTTKLVKKAKDDWDLTLPELLLWTARNHELVLKELKKEKELLR